MPQVCTRYVHERRSTDVEGRGWESGRVSRQLGGKGKAWRSGARAKPKQAGKGRDYQAAAHAVGRAGRRGMDAHCRRNESHALHHPFPCSFCLPIQGGKVRAGNARSPSTISNPPAGQGPGGWSVDLCGTPTTEYLVLIRPPRSSQGQRRDGRGNSRSSSHVHPCFARPTSG